MFVTVREFVLSLANLFKLLKVVTYIVTVRRKYKIQIGPFRLKTFSCIIASMYILISPDGINCRQNTTVYLDAFLISSTYLSANARKRF